MHIQKNSIYISEAEFTTRSEALLSYIRERKLDGVVLFDNYYILYFTGFAFIPTERPIAYLLNREGENHLFVPRLEFEHASSSSIVDKVSHYTEYPSDPHPMSDLKRIMLSLGFHRRIGSDQEGYPWILGYRGPSLHDIFGIYPIYVTEFIEDEMMIKSPAEQNLVRESVKWGNLAHVLLQRYTRVGRTETEVSLRASMEASLAMLDAIGPIYKAQSPFSSGPSAGYRGQIGRNSSIPHALSNNIKFEDGDVLVTGAGAPIWGYQSELERTMIVGPPSEEQAECFEHMLNLQNIAFDNMGPGIPCSEVDLAVRAYYKSNDLMDYWKHHVGHAIGLRYHEGPFLDIGDKSIMKPGMIFTVEPGLYVEGLGGFRHSDTVLINNDGIEMLTYYPRDLDNLVIPI